jgi:hypothetical protein
MSQEKLGRRRYLRPIVEPGESIGPQLLKHTNLKR